MKTIIVHHVQSMWNEGLKKHNTSFEHVLEQVCDHIRSEDYDRVIVTNFEADRSIDDDQYPLAEFYPEVYDYGYGWEREQFEDYGYVEGIDFCEGGYHSEVVAIDDWMRKLYGDVSICGAFDGECIEDLEIALDGAGITFNRIEHLII